MLLLLALMGYFWIYAKHLPSNLPDESKIGIGDWGAFGDFMGGLLNPAVAFAAFYWLTQSVKLQKTELAETRKALEESAVAQQLQASSSKDSVLLQAISASLNSIQLELSVYYQIRSEYERGRPSESHNLLTYVRKNSDEMRAVEEKIKTLEKNRNYFQEELIKVMNKFQTSAGPL